MCVRADLMAAIMKATACSDVIRSGWGRFEGRAVHSPGKELSGGGRSNRQSCQTSHIHNSSKTLRNDGVDATHVDRLLITYEHRSCFPRNYASSTTGAVPLSQLRKTGAAAAWPSRPLESRCRSSARFALGAAPASRHSVT